MDRGQEKLLTFDTPGQGGTNEVLADDTEGLRREIALREQAEEDLQSQLQFERLLTDIATHFVILPAEQIEKEIEDSQCRICEFLDIDRSTLWLVSQKDTGKMLLRYIYQPSEGVRIPKLLEAQTLFPWIMDRLLSGETLIIEKLADLPPEAARDRETFELYSVKSTIVIPISIGQENLYGVIAFGMTREERVWSEIIVRGLQLVAQVFASALERARSGQRIREGETRLNVATEASGAILWSMELDNKRVWVTPMIRELFGLGPDTEVLDEEFFKVVHQEDRERLQQAIEKACQHGGSLSIEFRVEVPGENIRWVLSQGKVLYASNGEPDCLVCVSIDITERREIEQQLKRRLEENERLRRRLESENVFLKEEVNLTVAHDIVGQSDAMKTVLMQADQVAQTDSTVLIMGETGTGKELLARAIHRMGKRQGRPLVTVNCASLPPTLIESELFGREKGAYTGAMTKMIGRFEIADGSTLFLDEIGELPVELQTKLLRVLEEGVFERLGSTRPIKVNIRLIAATNRDLADDVKAGRFRKDLYYRLNVFPITVPPLRDRAEDIPLMVWTFVNEFQQRMGKRIEIISKKGMEAMKLYSWPGNVRELRNVIERAMITTRGEILNVTLPWTDTQETFEGKNLQEVERRHILSILEKTHWRVTGKGSAAEILGLKRSTLQSKMKKLGIKRPGN
jgi:PAS domain S-box-containing protein